jgi:hypothetical protein
VALWNEPDARARRAQIDDLWIEDCVFLSASSERRGRPGIEAEAFETYETCGAKGYVFSSAGKGDGHHDVVRFNWEMRPRGGGAVAAAGFVVLLLDENGRIRVDYQFDEADRVTASTEGTK